MLMRKCALLVTVIFLGALIAGCGGGEGDGGGGSDFATVEVESSRIEEDDSGASYLVLAMEIENLTDGVLYIESTSPTDEKGEKHIWFVIKDSEGNGYASSYYAEIENDIFPMSVSPRTVTYGEMAFDVTGACGVLTLEVSQSETGDGGTRVIYTEDVTP